MCRILLTLMALWSLLMVPALCLAGTLEHSCADCPAETGCGHEEDCLEDPCDVEIVAPGVRPTDWEPALILVQGFPWDSDLTGLPTLVVRTSFLASPLLREKLLPYPETSIPLLI